MKGARPRSSTEYVREFRRRMREAGLVKREVWIRPERSPELTAVEKQLRQPRGAVVGSDEERSSRPGWTGSNDEKLLNNLLPILFNNLYRSSGR